MPIWIWMAVLLLVVVVVGAALLYWMRPRNVPATFARAEFDRRRADLQAHFLEAASRSGKPRGLRWVHCEWGEAVELVRDRQTGQLLVLAGVTISFEAIAGSDMEGLPAVGNLRNASAVFVFDGLHWTTAGRAVFNLNPDEALQHFGMQYERVEVH